MVVLSQLLQSNGQRSFAARGALKEAESRAKELAKIEETITELAQLFNDVSLVCLVSTISSSERRHQKLTKL